MKPRNYLQFFLTLTPKVHREWNLLNTKMEYEYRKQVPEAKVVDAVRAYIDSAYSTKEDHAKCWQDVLKAIRDLDEGELKRVQDAQERYDKKFGKVSLNAPTETVEEVFGKEITGSDK